MNETQLILRCRKGDLQAFEELVRRKRDRVFWTAYRVVGDEDAAKDVSQAVFLRVWKHLDRIDTTRPLDPWLHRTTVNLAIDAYRKTRREVRLVDGWEPPGPAASRDPANPHTALAETEVRRLFDRLAARLTPMQRAAFVLVEIEGYTATTAGEMLGIRPSTVRNHLLNARRQLRRYLRRHYPEYAGAAGRGPEESQ